MVTAVSEEVDKPKQRNRGACKARKIDLDLLAEWLADGLTKSEIARRFGVSIAAVCQSVKRYKPDMPNSAPIVNSRTDLSSVTCQEQSDAFRLDMTWLLFQTTATVKTLAVPKDWKALGERQTVLTSLLNQGKTLFGWDAAAGSGSGAININLLASKAVVTTTQPQQSPVKPHTVPTPQELEHGETLENVTLDVTSEADPSTGPAHLV